MSQKLSSALRDSSVGRPVMPVMMESLEGRTLLATVGGVDPFNLGKGEWIWQVSAAETNTGTKTVAALVDFMKKKGFKWLVVKAGDGNDGPGGTWKQFNKTLIDTVHTAGLKIFAYHFVYGGKTPNSRNATTTASGEKTVRDAIMALNPDGLIVDAETDFENLSTRASVAEDYAKTFKQKFPTKLLGLDTFAYTRFHPNFPYINYLKYADVAMPQMFWKSIATANTPEQILKDVDEDWKKLYAGFATAGHPEAARPIVPIGQGFNVSSTNPTPGAEITRFFDDLRNDADPASPFGYNGVSFFSAQQHNSEQYLAIGNGTLSAPNGSISGNVFNDLNADRVRQNNEPGLSGRVVFDDTNFNGVHDANEGFVKTDSAGNYKLPFMAARSHRIRQVLPTGWRQTEPTSAAAQNVTLTSGQQVTGKNFGATQLALIAGSVYHDQNANGVKDLVETTLSGWTVFADADKDGVLDTNEVRAVTNSKGDYVLQVPAGSYQIREVVQSGFRVTQPGAGFYDLTLAAAQISSNIFGNTTRIVISGFVFNDLDRNGIKESGEAGLKGWRVFVDLDGDSILDGNELSVLTDSNGKYRFGTLAAGTYRIVVVQQSAFNPTVPNPPVRKVTVASGGTTSNKNFGQVRIS